MKTLDDFRCMKIDRIRSFSGPHFPAFGLHTERHGVKSVWMRENTDQKKSEYGYFLRSVSSGSESVSLWVTLWDIHTKSRVLATITKFRVIISIDLITILRSNDCYILLPAFKVKMRVERQLFWQAGDDVRIRGTTAWCGWVGITGKTRYLFFCTFLVFRVSVTLFFFFFFVLWFEFDVILKGICISYHVATVWFILRIHWTWSTVANSNYCMYFYY